MLLLILGMVDVIAGGILALFGLPLLRGNGFVLSLGILMLIKGVISYLLACANRFYFDVMGVLDLIAGALLLMVVYGIGLFFFPYVGILVIIKGIYSSVVWLSHAK